MNFNRRKKIFAPSGILTPPGRILGDAHLSYETGEAIESLKIYGRAVMSRAADYADPPAIDPVGDPQTNGFFRVGFRVHNESLFGGAELTSKMRERVPSAVTASGASMVNFRLAEGTDALILGPGDIAFKPRTVYTVSFSYFIGTSAQPGVQNSQIAIAYADGSYEFLVNARSNGGNGYISEQTTDPEKDFIGLRCIYCETKNVTVMSQTFSIREGVHTYSSSFRSDVDNLTPTLTSPLYGAQGKGRYVADVYDVTAGQVTRRFRDALADGATVEDGRFVIRLSQPADMALSCSICNFLPRLEHPDQLSLSRYGYAFSEDGGRIDLIPPGRSSIEEGDFLLGSFTNEKLLYAVASPTVVGTGQALSLRARTGYTGVSVSTCVAPHRTELIHA